MTFNFERRLATFKQFNWPHSISKTGSKNKYKSQPEDFAQAGFYCRPLQGSTDTVACFLCLKSLDGWEQTDSAWLEHKSHSCSCPLVTLHSAASRMRTFERWSGAQVKGGVRALVDAGFYHFPKADGDDTCICFQCGLALDGWEESDDPRYEHERRRPKCPHIAANQYYEPASFDFILNGEVDDKAIKEIDDPRVLTQQQRQQQQRPHHISETPLKASNALPATSTVKKTARKITISLPKDSTKASIAATPTTTRKKRTIKAVEVAELTQLFGVDFSSEELLDLTMAEFMKRLLHENVQQFSNFLNNQ